MPAVEYLSGKRGWKRGPAALTAMMGMLAVVVVFLIAIIPIFVDQVVALFSSLPELVDNGLELYNDALNDDLTLDELKAELNKAGIDATSLGVGLAGGVLGFASTILGAVFKALTIGLFVFYILADLPKLRAASLSRFKPAAQERIDTIITITIEKVGGYVYSRSVLALFSAAFHFVVFWIIGLPYALALALWVGVVSQFVPTIGTYLAGVVPFLVALLSGDPKDAVWVLIAITAYQQVENYLISPKVTANTMELHPAVAFGSAIVGGSLLGGIGALLALPVAATITGLVQTFTDSNELVESETFDSPEEYEARLRERDAKRRARDSRLRMPKTLRRKNDTETDADPD
jgi:predicted PurR-regulated permease PerM